MLKSICRREGFRPGGSQRYSQDAIVGHSCYLNLKALMPRDGHRTNVRYVRGEYSPRTPIERTRMGFYSLIANTNGLYSVREWPLIRTLISERFNVRKIVFAEQNVHIKT